MVKSESATHTFLYQKYPTR